MYWSPASPGNLLIIGFSSLFLQGRYKLCVTIDILNEYAEIIERYFSPADVELVLTEMMLNENVVQIVRYFEWNVIEKDADDNKFFDCAVAANADYIVSEDKHFDVLKNITFPAVAVVKTIDFRGILKKMER